MSLEQYLENGVDNEGNIRQLVQSDAVEKALEVAGTLSHKSSRVKTKKKKKVVKPKKPVPGRIVVHVSKDWSMRTQAVVKAIKLLEPKTLDYVITNAEMSLTNRSIFPVYTILDKLGVPVIQVRPWKHIPNSGYLQRGKIMKMFKPTMILVFAPKDSEDQAVIDWQKFARKADIDFRLVSK